MTYRGENILKKSLEEIFNTNKQLDVIGYIKIYNGDKFTRRDVENWLTSGLDRGKPFLFKYVKIPESTLEKAVDVAIESYLDKGWIRQYTSKDFEE